MRRSSTARSISARSDFDDDLRSMTNSVHQDEIERERERSEADEHMHRYITDELNRYKDENLSGNYEHADEFETKA